MRARLWIVVLMCLLASTGLPESAKAQEAIRVGIYNLPPWGDDPAGGFCFELMEAIGSLMDLRIDYVPLGSQDLIDAVVDGRIDAECSGWPPDNRLRNQGVVFTGAHSFYGEVFIVPATDDETRFDFRAMAVGTIEGAVEWLAKLTEGGATDISTFPNAVEGFRAVVDGEIDGFMVAQPTWAYEREILGRWLDLKATWPSAIARTTFHGSIAVRPEDTQLLGILQAGLETLKANGFLAALVTRYGFDAPAY